MGITHWARLFVRFFDFIRNRDGRSSQGFLRCSFVNVNSTRPQVLNLLMADTSNQTPDTRPHDRNRQQSCQSARRVTGH